MNQRPPEPRRGKSPWAKVLFTAVVGAGGILSSGVGPELITPETLALGLLGAPLGVLLLVVSLALTAPAPLRAVAGASRLLRRWHRLPRGEEPFLWTVLVVVAEEGIFRLAAFAFLPTTWWSFITVSLVFTVVHLPRILGRRRPLRVGAASFVLSIALCAAYVASESFWLVVAAHLVHNLALNALRGALRRRREERRGKADDEDEAGEEGDRGEGETM